MGNVLTPKFRVSYPNVFKPRKNDLNGKDEYSLVALFEKGTDLTVLKQAAQAAIEEMWGKDKAKWPANLRTPFRDQGEKKKTNDDGVEALPAGHVAGAIFLNLRTQHRPGLVDGTNGNQDIIDETVFYGGCWARASLRAYAYDQKGNRGVAFGLQNLQKVADGEPLAGRVKASDEFAPVEGAGSNAGTNPNDLFG